jgi:hypothetical protein
MCLGANWMGSRETTWWSQFKNVDLLPRKSKAIAVKIDRAAARQIGGENLESRSWL